MLATHLDNNTPPQPATEGDLHAYA
jgi:hypothetical protein